MRYKIEQHTANGWATAVEFKESDSTRSGKPMDYKNALAEAKAYKKTWPGRIVRIIIIL